MEKLLGTARKNETEFDDYYVAYNIMVLAMKEKEILEGIKKALYLAKINMNAEDIIIYKKDEETGEYKHVINQVRMENNSYLITYIINQLYAKQNQIVRKNLHVTINNELQDIVFQPIESEGNTYVIAITNPKMKSEAARDQFISVFKEAIKIVLKRMELQEEIERDSKIDRLTGLENRNVFENAMEEFQKNGDECVFAIFDLFQLKTINDTYSHHMGDKYIKRAAEILHRYFPTYRNLENQSGLVEKVDTGTKLFRIGGDEYVVISTNSNEDLLGLKSQLAVSEVSEMKIGQDDSCIIGLNFGLATREKGESMKSLYKRADEKLKKDKSDMYVKLKIDRRRV